MKLKKRPSSTKGCRAIGKKIVAWLVKTCLSWNTKRQRAYLTGPYPELDESSPQLIFNFLKNISILFSHLCLCLLDDFFHDSHLKYLDFLSFPTALHALVICLSLNGRLTAYSSLKVTDKSSHPQTRYTYNFAHILIPII
jgi:hypothetical protein